MGIYGDESAATGRKRAMRAPPRQIALQRCMLSSIPRT